MSEFTEFHDAEGKPVDAHAHHNPIPYREIIAIGQASIEFVSDQHTKRVTRGIIGGLIGLIIICATVLRVTVLVTS